jgi:uncharacterized protein (DUF2249 family)
METLELADCIDVRTISPPARHPLIFARFDALGPGEHFTLLNDHDPLPLYFQFERSRSGQFTWDYVEAGPQRWQVRVGRVASGPGAALSGGGCGGACRCAGG